MCHLLRYSLYLSITNGVGNWRWSNCYSRANMSHTIWHRPAPVRFVSLLP
jgi:hypothetical protein